MMGAKSRSKGARGERQAAEALRSIGIEAKRRGQTSRFDGADLQTPLSIHFEVKRREAVRLSDWCYEAHRDAAPGHVPVVLHRKSREPWRVTVDLTDLPELARTIAAALDTE